MEKGRVDRNSGSGFINLDNAGIAAARTVRSEQNSLIACEPYCSSDATTALGTVIFPNESWFSNEKTYYWDRPSVWGENGRVTNFFGNPVLPKNPAAWVVGVGRHGKQEIPMKKHYSILREIGARAGYFAAPSGSVRKFNQDGACITISGDSSPGC